MKPPNHEFGSVAELKERHKATMDADPFADRAENGRLVWLLRVSVLLNVVLAFSQVGLAQAFLELFPLKETQVALIRGDDLENKIFQVEPISEKVRGFNLMLEKLSKRYVTLLLGIDAITQEPRFEEAKTYSDREFFNNWIREEGPRIEEAIEDGLNRSIIVEGANLVSAYGDHYQYVVDFIRIDKIADQQDSKPLRAYLQLAPRPQEVTEREKYENPLGIRVLNMIVKERIVK